MQYDIKRACTGFSHPRLATIAPVAPRCRDPSGVTPPWRRSPPPLKHAPAEPLEPMEPLELGDVEIL